MLRIRNLMTVSGTALALASVLVVPGALAQGFTINDTGAPEAANKAGYQTNLACMNTPGGCIPAYAGTIVSAFAGIFGAFFFCLILYGGFLYMTAGGEPAKTVKARETIVNAIIGMLIVASSYAIASYVLNAMSGVTTGLVQVD